RGLPVRIGEKLFPRLLGGFSILVRQQINQFVVRVVHRHPVAHVHHAVLFKNLAGVIAEAGVEIIQLAWRGIIDPQFVAASIGGGWGFRSGKWWAKSHNRQRNQANDFFHSTGLFWNATAKALVCQNKNGSVSPCQRKRSSPVPRAWESFLACCSVF